MWTRSFYHLPLQNLRRKRRVRLQTALQKDDSNMKRAQVPAREDEATERPARYLVAQLSTRNSRLSGIKWNFCGKNRLKIFMVAITSSYSRHQAVERRSPQN
jgi:hypothetical protein